ncbi:NADP transhydrogenase subunit alpha, putative [Entamoeba invadens IP1]|uniref:proton-translocating NAD(P)(+) transhydrogenase n=2 Tax=Entamoeba invadens TaxID=33085 RepID=A0A0A1U2E2_ENTIV|nr:NADP transhydrogenase subunit alpha, putative [Entamoeba invadens IP1]ELP88204.1 NADP transhydrogenase subunit alpha, putative [Entamoeba invadens IP1]|eukprot:XP_004254975.1 NADP transhydrogenase subunit alpha, putative [Entamoeba invadens IP1]
MSDNSVNFDYEKVLSNIVSVGNIVVSLCFILALRGLSAQTSAKMGNIYGIIGMSVAFFAAIMNKVCDYFGVYADEEYNEWILYTTGIYLVCIIPAAVIGIFIASKVEMVQMPQLVAGFHSFVGLAAVLIGFAHWIKDAENYTGVHEKTEENGIAYLTMIGLETVLGIFIGGLTFTGSIVAFGKLQGIIRSKPLIIGGNFRHVINAVSCAVGCLLVIPYIAVEYISLNDYNIIDDNPDTMHDIQYNSVFINMAILMVVTIISFFIGWHLVMAIGGADMPVVISMLNSYSGWATAAAGFLLNNYAMIVSGALIGSSGAILSYIMCAAMNRGFLSVILGIGTHKTETAASPVTKNEKDTGNKEVNPIEVGEFAKLLVDSHKIAIVPGYGMAVAKAQHVVAELANMLTKAGKTVNFIIHPVAGRLPGHMNVLLAEASVPYKIVFAMEEVEDLSDYDVCIVVGANDTVNPIAETDPNCPLAGMPIIKTYQAKVVVVNKRSLNQGYAAVDNPLFFFNNTRMYLKDSKAGFESLNSEVKKILGEVVHTETTESGATEKTGLLQGISDAAPVKIDPEDLFIGVPKEKTPEKMVAMVPSVCKQLRSRGYGIYIESGAGLLSTYSDEDYRRVGCKIAETTDEVYEKANIICKVNPPTEEEIEVMKQGQTLISFFYPKKNPDLLEKAVQKGITVISMDCVPRVSNAQCMDALSSQNNLAGYRSIIEASNKFGRLLMGQVTAAGKSQPANVFIIGVGVSGLAAISTAKALGAQVKAFDSRAAAKEQAESVGAEFCTVSVIEDSEDKNTGYAKAASQKFIDAEYALFRQILPEMDIVVTTANIPGRTAPILVTQDMVDSMKIGSVIVDLAAPNGGNCEVTRSGETYVYDNKVTVIGQVDFTVRMAPQASQLYAQNIFNFMNHVCKKATEFVIKSDDVIQRQMTVCSSGQNMYPAPPMEIRQQPPKKETAAPSVAVAAEPEQQKKKSYTGTIVSVICLLLLVIFMLFMPSMFVTAVMSFVLAIIVGYYVIWNVTSALHTPLMSVTNAISGIIAVGGITNIYLTPMKDEGLIYYICVTVVGCLAVFIACLNVFGGFFITHRMLQMFH